MTTSPRERQLDGSESSMFTRIIVPVDGSEASQNARALAGKLGRAFEGRVRLVHWLDVQAFPNVLGYGAPVIQTAQEYAELLLQQEQSRLQAEGINAETHLLLSRGRRLGECIGDEVKAWQADAVVLGSHGRRGIARALLGSGAEQILREAGVPALVMRGAGSTATLKRILVAVDGSDASAHALDVATRLAARCEARMLVVHSIGELASFGAYGYADAFLETVRQDADKMLREAAALSRRIGVEAHICLSAGNVGLGSFVAQQAHDWNADLVVAGTHGRRGFRRAMLGSGAEQIVRLAPTSVLVVPPASAQNRVNISEQPED